MKSILLAAPAEDIAAFAEGVEVWDEHTFALTASKDLEQFRQKVKVLKGLLRINRVVTGEAGKGLEFKQAMAVLGIVARASAAGVGVGGGGR